MKTIFEQTGGTYSKNGDYLIPDLMLQYYESDECTIGVWGYQHLRFLQQNQMVRYINLLANGSLDNYLDEIDRHAQALFSRLVKQFAYKEGVTESLKEDNQIVWMQKMNSIKNRAMETVNANLIYC
ncbi:MAG: TnpV protein [Clostridiales bacterium]|nr:TnpV protein [Clostridiales bacterium]